MVPFASLLVPVTLVFPTSKVLVMTGAAVTACTVTEFEKDDTASPDAVAFAVMTWPAVKAVNPVLIQALLETVVVVPDGDPST